MTNPSGESFVGTWKGQWDQTQDFQITIEKVVDGKAHYSYRFEACPHWDVKEAHGGSGVANVQGRDLKVNENLEFKWVDDNRIDGKLMVGPYTNLGAFLKA